MYCYEPYYDVEMISFSNEDGELDVTTRKRTQACALRLKIQKCYFYGMVY